MYRTFEEVVEAAAKRGPFVLSIAAAEDQEVLAAVAEAAEKGLISPIFVGDAEKIETMLKQIGIGVSFELIHEPNQELASKRAVQLVYKDRAQLLMKGLVNSSIFLKAILDKKEGLRTGRLLSHLSVFQIPSWDRLLFITDGGINIAPGFTEKRDILTNALTALNQMGIAEPAVAILTANEKVNEKMPSTIDARELVKLSNLGKLPPSIVEGPIALDVAVSEEAARHKGIASKIAGKTDLILVPNIETGNALGKALTYIAQAKMAGIVLGASNPVVLTSRADDSTTKLNSIALACLAS